MAIQISRDVIPSRRGVSVLGLCLTIIFRRTIAEIPVHTGNLVGSDICVKLNDIAEAEFAIAAIAVGEGHSVHVYTLLHSRRTGRVSIRLILSVTIYVRDKSFAVLQGEDIDISRLVTYLDTCVRIGRIARDLRPDEFIRPVLTVLPHVCG